MTGNPVSTWDVFTEPQKAEVHVIPRLDLVSHQKDSFCHCWPVPEVQDNLRVLYVHNPADGRERA